MNRSYRMTWIGLVGCLLCLAETSARADESWTVTLDTSQLAVNYTSPFGLDFELIGANGNTVTLTDFSFGNGGSAGPGAAFLTGGAGGDLGGSVVLSDAADFFSDFNQQFTPGDMLSFTVDSTVVPPPSGGIPDNFSMVIFSAYDPVNGYNPSTGAGGTPIPTTDPTGADTFLSLDINGPGSTTPSGYPSVNGDVSITITPQSVPEPSSGAIVASGLVCLAGVLFGARRRTGRGPRRGTSLIAKDRERGRR
jgi:hypothetical protein